MYLFMGHTAKFAVEQSSSSRTVLQECLEHHESVGPGNLEIH